MTADYSSVGSFNNLTIGKTYQLSWTGSTSLSANGVVESQMYFRAVINGVEGQVQVCTQSRATTNNQMITNFEISLIWTTTTDNVQLQAMQNLGTNGRFDSVAWIKELNNAVETSDFT